MFTGFTDETVDFMWGIRFNNERSWFEAHKEVYLTHFYQPMRELGDEVYAFLREQRPDAGLVRRVSRRLTGNLRAAPRPGPLQGEPVVFHLSSPQRSGRPIHLLVRADAGGLDLRPGLLHAEACDHGQAPGRMDRDPKPMEKLTRALARQEEFLLETEDYKRPRSAAPSKVLEPWYRAKRFTICHQGQLEDALFCRDIVDRLKEGYRFLLPYYDQFSTLDSDPDPGTHKKQEGPSDGGIP